MSDAPGTGRAPDADLPRPFENGGQNDVHDAYSSYQQRNRGDGHHHIGEDHLRALLFRQKFGRDGDSEILHAVVRGVQDGHRYLGRQDAVRSGLSSISTRPVDP